ncbi:MAG: DUF5995 family protein [Ferruginibacter sp.]
MQQLNTIDDVIVALGNIILEAENNNDTSAYFAALYRKVTIKVKEGIANNEFEDGARMEKLDVVFASRYINAYYAWKNNKPVSASWQKAFDISGNYWPIVLQHLLMGMNAHINLDLGVAAAEISKGKDINSLQNDFNKINTILSSLVAEVQNNLANIWPRLKWILQKTRRVDDFMVDFSMQLSRDGAWKYAVSLAGNADGLDALIAARDKTVAEKSKIVTYDGFIASLVLSIIRIGERGSIKQKIERMKATI